MKYQVLVDGIGVAMPTNTKFKFACCDCGLVHDMVVAVLGKTKTFGFAVRRNIRATNHRRGDPMAKNWIANATKNKGGLHRSLGIPEGQKIPAAKVKAAAKKPGKVGKEARLAQTLGKMRR